VLTASLPCDDVLRQMLRDIRTVRQGREIDLHNATMMTHTVAPQPIAPA
jgi:hypothetical protein